MADILLLGNLGKWDIIWNIYLAIEFDSDIWGMNIMQHIYVYIYIWIDTKLWEMLKRDKQKRKCVFIEIRLYRCFSVWWYFAKHVRTDIHESY